MEYRSYKLLRDFSKFLRFSESLKDEETRKAISILRLRNIEQITVNKSKEMLLEFVS